MEDLNMGFNPALKRFFAPTANESVNLFPVFLRHVSGNTHHTVLRRFGAILIDVYSLENYLTFELFFEFRNDRIHHFTRTTPGGPKVFNCEHITSKQQYNTRYYAPLCYHFVVKNNPFSDLNDAQKTAVMHPSGPALVVAGPGSGKTRVLTYHASYLIKENLTRPAGIFLCTFTNKAANEMKERIRKIGKEEVVIPWAGTFHSLCSRLLRIYGPAYGINRNFLIYDQNDARSLIRRIIKEKNIMIGKSTLASLLSIISSAKNELIDETEFLRYAVGPLKENAARIYPTYQKALKENNAFDFDDLLVETVKLLKRNKDLCDLIQNQFDHILIDEYQDTNKVQYAFAKLISQKKRNIYAVGDVSQAIYSFRGADFRNILSFERDFPDARIYQLSQNYRSTRVIIESARSLIQNNSTHVSLNLWTDNEEGDKIKLYEALDEIDEANYIVNSIRTALNGSSSNSLSFRDFAVLYRTNAQSRAIEEKFLRDGLPYTLVGGTEFYERKEIKDVLCLLRLFINPADTVSLERIEKNGKKRSVQYINFLENLKERQKLIDGGKPLEILDLILDKTEFLSTLEDGSPEGEERVENVKELRSVASSFESLIEFLENVSLIQHEYTPTGKTRKNGQEKDAIYLMTLHAAKGLEFQTVFLVGLEEGLLPHARSLIDQSELEEERRLCYVGMTRAKKNLHLTYARQRLFFGSRNGSIISRFISEIPERSISFEESFF